MNDRSISIAPLARRVIWRALVGFATLMALFFGGSGTLYYWQAWVYIGLVILLIGPTSLWLMRNDPELLERRTRTRERVAVQKWVVASSGFVFLLLYLLPGLDRRFGWSHLPLWLVLAGDALVVGGYALFLRVLRENRYASRVIEVDARQKVVESGPYAMVRHPMYLSYLILYLGTVLGLGSCWALLPWLGLFLVLVARALNEEKVLLRELPGYEAYTRKVRRRFFPGVW